MQISTTSLESDLANVSNILSDAKDIHHSNSYIITNKKQKKHDESVGKRFMTMFS